MNDEEKKARDEAAELELGDHCWPFIRGWDACADWQAKRENSPDIRADNVSDSMRELKFAPMHFDYLPKSRDGRTTRADMCAQIANQMFQGWFAAYRDAQYSNSIKLQGDKVSDSSAEFPDAEFKHWLSDYFDGELRGTGEIDVRDGARWGFERGRASASSELLSYHRMASTGVWIQSEEYAQTVAKLAEAKAENESLKVVNQINADAAANGSRKIKELETTIARLTADPKLASIASQPKDQT